MSNKRLNKISIRVLALVVVLLAIVVGLVQASISSSPDWTQESNQANANIPPSIFTTRILVGAPYHANGQTGEGKGMVFFNICE